MQLKTVKTAADLPFKGIELVKVDNTISEVIIGGKLRIRGGQYGGMQVLVDSPGERVKRYRVAAKLEGFPDAIEHYEYGHEADDRARHFEAIGATVERSHIDVLLNELGAVSDAPSPTEAARELDEIPF